MMSNALLGGLVAAGAVAAGVAVFVVRENDTVSRSQPEEVVRSPQVVEQASSDVPDPTSGEDAEPVATTRASETPATPVPPKQTVPSLDLVRVDAAGAAVVAGTGPAAAEVTLRLDGQEVAVAQTDGQGNFVSLFDLPQIDAPGLLTLEARDDAGEVVRAEDSVIVAPTFPTAPAVASVPTTPVEPPASGAAETALAESVTDPTPETSSAEKTADIVAAAPPGEPAPALQDAAPARLAAIPSPEAAPTPTVPVSDGPNRLAAPAVVAENGPTAAPVAAPQPQTAEVLSGGERASPSPAAPPSIALAKAPQKPATPPAPPRLFRAGPSGVTLLTDPPASRPDATENLGIDAISYDALGDVQLTGRGASDSELRIYLNNRPIQTVRVGSEGAWSSPLPNVDSGVYTLRIDAVGADGTVISRVETPFQRTAPEIAAQLRREGASAITVQPGYTLWAISEGYFGDGVQYVQLFEANRDLIRDPDLIYPGQVFALPKDPG